MKKKRRLLVFGALVLIVFGAVMLHPFPRQLVFGPDRVPVEEIVQGDALEDYRRDPEKADKKYGGNRVIVSGKVSAMRNHGHMHEIYFDAPGDRGVYCFGWLPELDKIRRGDSVRIKGISKYLSDTWYGEGISLRIEPLPQLTECELLPNE
jgi:hypothetical protein